MDSPEGGAGLAARERAAAVAELSGLGHDLADLLEAAGLARSTYYYALANPKGPTRPELRGRVAEIFGRLPNGVGHRQIAMELRAVDGARIADKTVLKMMREMDLRCGIRRETDYHRYNSYRGVVGETFENVLGRDFEADGPWQKMGTDVTEFRLSFGKAYLAPVYDFGSKEIVAHAISLHADLAQQEEMLAMLMAAKPEGASPILHSDMGWQYQHATYVRSLAENGFTQSMSRKGNCIDNGATEQVFGHLKDEFFRGRDWGTFEEFKRDLEEYIHHWNHVRRQAKLKGLTPAEFRNQALQEAA
ncbi:IS3 family transposase [Collinsella tanakaei]|uniref:IS3 family transposase n=1 Tax=Collinsella tanakaei TaxID=626935 RepID=UPI0025A47079|nr:IS3 family transposase [Collinsella tanakaei]MDM8301982.1 IS3 family transposase [Collinsella tanakaei]